MSPLTRLALAVMLALLSAGSAIAEGVESIEGCDVNFFRVKWVKDNDAKISWSGACKKGLADGSGVVFLTAPDGTWARFVGTLAAGWAVGEGDYRMTDGTRKVGRFVSNLIGDGKLYDTSGRLVFQGTFVDGAPSVGTYWLPDGGSLKGTLDPDVAWGAIDRERGLAYGTYHDATGDVVRWQVAGAHYANQTDFDRAVASYQQYLYAKREAERVAAEQRAAAERAQREADAARTYGAITGALLGAANVYVQQQQAQLGYTAPALPVWTPPAPSYTPPAPVYQAPVYQAPAYQAPTVQTPAYRPPASTPSPAGGSGMPDHHPELDAKHCLKVEDDSYGRVVMANRCGQAIEVSWCVVGRDCNPGFSNMHSLHPGSTWPIGTGHVNINFGACFGVNKLWSTTELSRAMQYRCVP